MSLARVVERKVSNDARHVAAKLIKDNSTTLAGDYFIHEEFP